MTDEQEKRAAARIDAALEQKPAVVVPADFALRVVRALPARRPASSRRFGRLATFAGCGVLAAAMFAFAPHTVPSFASVRFDVEMLMVAELAGLVLWMSARRDVWQ